MNVFCQRCGSAMPGVARFCSSCGAGIPPVQSFSAPPMPGRPLIRPRFGREIGGVCIALAQTHGWDVTAVRILAVVALVCSTGLVGIAYLAAWVGIPEETPALPGAYPPGI